MATQHRHRLVWLGVFACACAADEDPQSLERYAVEMQLTIDAMHTALAAHHESMHALSDLDAVDILERDHAYGLAERIGQLERAQDGVTMCGQHMMRAHDHAGMVPLMAQNGAMDDLLGEAYRELDRHAQAMDLAATLDLALAEEGEYARIMDGLLDRFSAHCEGMLAALDDLGEGASLRCPAYTRVPASR